MCALAPQDGGTHMTCGDVDAIFGGADCAHVLEGEVRLGGQEHFYLETNGSYVAPTEEDELLMVSSTQNPSKHQQVRSAEEGGPVGCPLPMRAHPSSWKPMWHGIDRGRLVI